MQELSGPQGHGAPVGGGRSGAGGGRVSFGGATYSDGLPFVQQSHCNGALTVDSVVGI